jgi:hypothetical protein
MFIFLHRTLGFMQIPDFLAIEAAKKGKTECRTGKGSVQKYDLNKKRY